MFRWHHDSNCCSLFNFGGFSSFQKQGSWESGRHTSSLLPKKYTKRTKRAAVLSKKGKFLAEKARKQVDTAASWEGSRNATVACVMRATASFTHPVFTHPKQKPEYYTKKTRARGVSLPVLKHRLDHRRDGFALALKSSTARTGQSLQQPDNLEMLRILYGKKWNNHAKATAAHLI